MTTENDWELYGKFKNGDLPSFHELFDRYKIRLFNLSYRVVKNKEAAEDIAQEVLIKIYEKKVEFSPKAKFSTWVYRVTVNASLDHLKKRKFVGWSLDTPVKAGDDDSAPLSETLSDKRSLSSSDALAKEEEKRLVERAVSELPAGLRTVILLYQFERKSYREIADILRISIKAVERRIYHAKQILREKLASHLRQSI